MSASSPARSRRRPRKMVHDAPEDLRAINELIDIITAATRSPRQRDRIARATGLPLTIASIGALRVVEQGEGSSATEVAHRLGIDPSTVSRQLRPLEERGLVTRTVDETDRRVTRLSVTATGRRVLERVELSAIAQLSGALESWSVDDRALLCQLITRLNDDLLSNPEDPA
jgi:DNA-binding MarR family transcriptional regulator